jgi:hypothetical protein
MSRITGSDAKGLMEAYSSVYAPQELTEEQVWEEVENWVNSLLEEGYDLSEYTWEEMYEAYLSEDLMGDLRANAGNIVRGATGAYQGAMRTASNVNQALVNRIKPKPSPTFQNTGGFGRYAAPSAQVKTPTPAARPAAPAAPRPAAPAARPAAAAPAAPKVAPKPAAATPAPAGGSALDRATAAASKPTAFSPKPQSDVGAMIARSQARQAAQTPKPTTPAPAARPMGGARGRMLGASFDPFDVIKGHLLDEGYADTEESALAIMANMSEEWRQSIVEADSIAAMRERAAKRRTQRYGASDTSRGGRDDFAPIKDYKEADKKWARNTSDEN